MHFSLITLFPECFNALRHGITGRALDTAIVTTSYWNPRTYADNTHGHIDDRPYGGGPGMVMQAPPIQKAIRAAVANNPASTLRIHLSPTGQPINQQMLHHLASYDHLVLLCGRYEGIDQRAIDSDIDLDISIGDVVLSGGELPAMVLMDALIRQQPGALGDDNSYREDSFYHGLLDHPHYSRPKTVENQTVPDILLSGDHAKITDWRRKASETLTKLRRPDMWAAHLKHQSEENK